MASSNVLTRPTKPEVAARGPSGIKSILFHVHEDDESEQRLQVALALARSCSAHLELLHVVPAEAYNIVDSFGGTFVCTEIVAALEEEAAKMKSDIELRLAKEDVSWNYQSVTSIAIAELVARAALADLVILGREPRERQFSRSAIGLAGQFLHRSHTPIFVPGSGKTVPDVNGKALIAWNGSLEAANAVRATIGLLKLASDVRVIRYTEKDVVFPGTRLLEYLSRHGIAAELEERVPQGDVAANLMTYAGTGGASYILMGGYSHSRAGEFLFGGVTRDLLRECPVSLVMAH